MDGYSNAIDAYLSGKPVEAAPAQQAPAAQAAPAAPMNSIDKYLSGDGNAYAQGIIEQAQTEGHDWERLSYGLKQVGADPEKFKELQQFADLNAAKRKAGGTGMTMSQSFRRDFMPFASLTSLNSLPNVPKTGNQWFDQTITGGRVVGNREYQEAVERFKGGKATKDDIDAIATYERHMEIDKDIKKQTGMGTGWKGFGLKLALDIGHLGQLGGETMIGTAPLGLFSKAPVAAAAGAAPALPAAATATVPRQLLNYAGSRVAPTLATPSMWVPMMQQNNMANNREANSWRGAPTALGYAYANMLVIGQLQGGIKSTTPLGYARESLMKGTAGLVEMQGVDAAAGVADQFLPKAYQIKPQDERWGTVGQWLRAYRAGDADKSWEALRDATATMLSFSAFGAMHGRQQKATDLGQAYADAYGKMREMGMGKTQAAEKLSVLHDKLEEKLSEKPYLTREEAQQFLNDVADPVTKPYAQKLADIFDPKANLPATEPPVPGQDVNAPKTTDPLAMHAEEIMRLVNAGVPEAQAREAVAKKYANPGKDVAVASAATPEARQPDAAAATPPEAPSVAPEAKTPIEPVQPAEVPNVEPAKAGATPGGFRLSEGRKAGEKDHQGNELTVHDIHDASGNVVGDAKVWQSGGTLHVHWIGVKDMAGGEGRGVNPIGTRELTGMMRELANKYPDAVVAKYTPAEGRINAGKAKWIDLVKVRERGELSDRRKAEKDDEGGPRRRSTDTPAEPVIAKSNEVKPEASADASTNIAPVSEPGIAPPTSPVPAPKRSLRDAAKRGDSTAAAAAKKKANEEALARVAKLNEENAKLDAQKKELDDMDKRTLESSKSTLSQINELLESAEGKAIPDEHPIKKDLIAAKASAEEIIKDLEPKVASAAAPLPQKAAPETPRVEPKPKAREATDADIKDQWESMTAAERLEAAANPQLRSLYEAAGIDVTKGAAAAKTKERHVAGKAAGVGAVGDKGGELGSFKKLIEESNLSATESQAVRGVAAGWTLEKIAKTKGMTRGGIQKAGLRAVKKMAARAMERMVDEAGDNPEAQERVKELAEEIDRLSEETKPASLEQIIRTLSGNEAAERRAAQAARGEVELDAEGRIAHTGDNREWIMHAGFPFRIAFLDRLIASKGGASQQSVFSKLRTAFFGGLPEAAAAARHQEIEAQIAAYAFDVANSEKDLRRAMREEGMDYNYLKDAQVKQLDDVLRGNAASRAGIGPKTLAALDNMRKQVDELSLRLNAVGAVDTPLVPTVVANIGSYLTRQYQVFRDPAWESKVDPAVVNRFKSWLTAELAKSGIFKTPAEIEAETKKLLRDGTAAENPIAFLRVSILGSKDISILKARKDIPPELRALWGEIEDPLVNYTNSVAKMAHLLTAHNFLTRLVNEGQGKFLFRDPTINASGEYVHKIAENDNPALRPLAPYHMTAEMKQAMQEHFAPKTTGAFMQWYMKGMAMAKFNKVVLSHTGQLRNFFSNVGIVVRNGLWDVRHLPGAFKAIVSDTPVARDYWRKLVELGIVGEGVHYRDFQETVNDAFGGRDAVKDAGGLVPIDSVLARMWKGGAKFAERMYHYGDSVWKVYAFEHEAARYEKAGMTRAQAEVKAAEVVRDTMPTYSKLAPGLQKLRRFPLAAPFISFQAEMVRTTKNAIKLAFSEAFSSDPKLRKIGAQRLAGLTAAAALPLAAAAALRNIYGVSPEEEDAVRQFLPEYQKQSMLFFTGRNKDGHLEYIDASKTDPHAYLTDAIRAAFNGKTTEEAATLAGKELAKPFISEELLVRPVFDIRRNQKEPGGKVYNPSDSFREQALAVLTHAGQPFVPGAYGPARRAFMSQTGQGEQKSGLEYDKADAIFENVTGQRIQPVRVEYELANKARRFDTKMTEAAKIVNQMIAAKGVVSPEELAQARQRTEKGRLEALVEMRKDVEAAERLGIAKPKIAKILRDAGLSIQDVQMIFSGKQIPYFPDLKGEATQRVRAGEVRKLGAASLRP